MNDIWVYIIIWFPVIFSIGFNHFGTSIGWTPIFINIIILIGLIVILYIGGYAYCHNDSSEHNGKCGSFMFAYVAYAVLWFMYLIGLLLFYGGKAVSTGLINSFIPKKNKNNNNIK